MLNNNNYVKKFVKKSSKLLNNIGRQNNINSFLLNNMINDLYLHLNSLVPEKIAFSASINSRDTFEYFLDYSVENIKLIINNNNDNDTWSLYYKVYPSYLDNQSKFENIKNNSNVDGIVIHLNDFFIKHVKKYYN